MTLFVPFDGSELAEAALVRAAEFGEVFEESVLAVSVVPRGNTEYARERDWISPREDFNLDEIVSELHVQVVDLAPSANFRHKVVGQHASSGTISKKIRQIAKQENASIVFLGSDNAGRLVSSISSVGANVGSDTAYDVLIVRDKSPARIAKLRTSSPHRKPKSDFYIPK